MELILKGNVIAKKHSMPVNDMNGFDAGVKFAETELQNLAIEFAEWIDKNSLWKCDSGQWYNDQQIAETTTELFKKFIEQRNQK